jgi:O-methyltransferase
MKKVIARSGKKLLEKAMFGARRALVDKCLDPERDTTIISWATYSPWLLDKAFMDCHALIKPYTLVDILRCYELWHLLGQTAGLEGDILEVGTWRGGTGGLLARRAANLSFPSTVHLCDTFSGVVKTGVEDRSYSGGEHSDTSVPVVDDLMKRLGVDNVAILQGIFPDDTGASLADTAFRFCHIDVDVYRSGKGVLDWVWPRLAVGGIVVFDDFGFPSTRGIAQLVHEEETRSDLVCVQNVNGHAVFIKKS